MKDQSGVQNKNEREVFFQTFRMNNQLESTTKTLTEHWKKLTQSSAMHEVKTMNFTLKSTITKLFEVERKNH